MNELTWEKEKVHNDFVTLQQTELKYAQSETDLRVAMNEIDRLKEENVRFCSQVRRLNKRIRSSEKEAKKALSALHKWGKVARDHGRTR
jgi:hypothetical protein